MSEGTALKRLLRALLGPAADRLEAQVYLAPCFAPHQDLEAIPRMTIAQALNLTLLMRSISEVPDLARYLDEKTSGASPLPFVMDHGAVRSVRHVDTGALPEGERAFTRFLEPLGYVEADTYPLPGLRMLGHGWCHADAPEDVAQYFISELNVDAFSPAFQDAVARVVATSKDPLSARSVASLTRLTETQTLGFEESVALVENLVTCFQRQHGPPALSDYEILRAESPEMAWIATEGHTFNHATDRVADVARVAEEQRALGRPIKDAVEVSSAGTVRQTAFEAVTVWRRFLDDEGALIERPVPGSFFEIITRDPHPTRPGLDLRFDSTNAQGIFAMTRR